MKTQKGITLIALIITIIVMLILVGVSVSVALNTGLFKAAQGAAKNTEAERRNETALSNGTVTVGNTTDSIQNIVNSYKGGTAGGGETDGGRVDLTDPLGTTQYSMTIDGTEYIIDDLTTFAKLEENSDYSFSKVEWVYPDDTTGSCITLEGKRFFANANGYPSPVRICWDLAGYYYS